MYHCLQSITPVPEIGHSLCSDTYPATSGQDVTVKAEEGLEAEVGEAPEPISFPEIKSEREVSYVSVFSLLHISQLLYAHMSVALSFVFMCCSLQFHLLITYSAKIFLLGLVCGCFHFSFSLV